MRRLTLDLVSRKNASVVQVRPTKCSMLVFVEDFAENLHAERIGVDDAARCGVVETGPFVAQRRCDDHDVPEIEIVDERTGAAAGDERVHAE